MAFSRKEKNRLIPLSGVKWQVKSGRDRLGNESGRNRRGYDRTADRMAAGQNRDDTGDETAGTAYLRNVKPRNPELVVDEMLAICSEIEAWKKKKESEAANAAYNELLRYGLGGEED